MKNVKNTALIAIGLLSTFIAVGLIALILNYATWEELTDITFKAVLVAAVTVGLAWILSLIGNRGKTD